MKDLETDLQKTFEKVLAEKNTDFDTLKDINFQEIEIEELEFDLPEIEIEELDIDIPIIEFGELPTATMPDRWAAPQT